MESPIPGFGTAAAVPERTSRIFERLAAQANGERTSVGTIVDALYDRSFGVLIILFALPNAILPLAWVLGLPIILFTVQMAVGRQEPWLPDIMRRQSMNRETFVKVISFAARYLAKIETWLKPRWNFLTTNSMERVLGVYMTFLTLVLLIPAPFGNYLPAFGLGIIAAGLLEKDGLAILIGSVIGALGAVYVVAVIGGIWAAAKALLGF
jgi:hypothetical protein